VLFETNCWFGNWIGNDPVKELAHFIFKILFAYTTWSELTQKSQLIKQKTSSSSHSVS